MAHVHDKHSPLGRAKTHERIATYSLALVIGLVVILVGRALTMGNESTADHTRIIGAIFAVVQFIIGVTTLALVRHQVGISVRQIEQTERAELRYAQLTDEVRKLADEVRGRNVSP